MKRVALRDFSLYSSVRTVEQELRPDSVFCLAGANGLGKSTFLAAINFGLTGIVASPTRNFENPRQFYDESIEWSRTYFDGRIEELDRAQAEIELQFAIGDAEYTLTRGLFEPLRLRTFKVRDAVTGATIVDERADEDSSDLHELYTRQLVLDCNLGDFSQFVFLQHYLLTFDERRHLLFWDEAASEPALYLAFGIDAQATVRASDLRKKINKAESDARNAQWQATQALNRIKSLGLDSEGSTVNSDLVEEHKALMDAVELANEAKARAHDSMLDARLQLAEAGATQASLKLQYSQLFSSQYEGSRTVIDHPLIQSALSERICGICGSRGDDVLSEVQRDLATHHCPLCDTEVDPDPSPSQTIRGDLAELDEKLADATRQADEFAQRYERLTADLASAEERLTDTQSRLDEFESKNADAIGELRPATDSLLAAKAAQLRMERTDAQRRRDQHRRRRDSYKEELRPIQEQLAETYARAEAEFVPLFRRLAYRFIGIDLDVFLRSTANALSIGLEVAGVRRRATTELSESQRFFLDIALRMALVEHMTSGSAGATLLIDTPEGSLDIAYEARAGEMFAEFVRRSNQIVMTANINASQLLKSLALECGSAHMDLLRMTNWAPLSEVQAQSEDLFDQAYEAIENALVQGDALAKSSS